MRGREDGTDQATRDTGVWVMARSWRPTARAADCSGESMWHGGCERADSGGECDCDRRKTKDKRSAKVPR